MPENETSRVELTIRSDDEFGGDYDEPGALTPEQVTGTVIYGLDWTVKTVIDQIDADPNDEDYSGVLVTSPPFQRRTAWNRERQSLFVESLILGLPVPPIVLAESLKHEGQFYVLDGKQRLTALKAFISDKNQSLRLAGLELLATPLEGKTYDEMRSDPSLRRYTQAMLAQPIRTIVVRNWRSPALLHLIFSRLNKQSVALASHELRQALFPGKFTNFINQTSAESAPLLRARRLKEPDFRLRDAETMLRYLALKTNLPNYRGDLRDFLDRVIKGGNDHFDDYEPELRKLVSAMETAIATTFEIFGEAAFLRFDGLKEKYISRFNIAVFDAMTWYFSDKDVAAKSAQNKAEVRLAFERLCVDNQTFAGYLTSTTKSSEAVPGRIRLWGESLGAAIDQKLAVTSFDSPFLSMAPGSR